MAETIERAGRHDVGGDPAGPIARDEHAAAHWEKEADAIRMLLADGTRRLFTADETRRVQEQLDAATYRALPCDERWIHAFSALLFDKGVLDRAEAEAAEARLRAAGLHHMPAAVPAHDHGHDHVHPRDHAAAETGRSPLRRRGIALRERLVARGILSGEEIRAGIERMDGHGEHLGARIVARAWADRRFRDRLAADGNAAAELGIEPAATRLTAVFIAPRLHNLVVCTLCSCYPRTVPGRPAGTEGWNESRLATLASRDSMIGVARARRPA